MELRGGMVVEGYMERTSGVEFILFTTKEEFIYKLFLHPQYHNSPSRIFFRTYDIELPTWNPFPRQQITIKIFYYRPLGLPGI